MADILICVALLAGFFVGWRRGMVRQIGSIVAVLAAIVACQLFGDAAAEVAARMMGCAGSSDVMKTSAAAIAGRIGLFLIVWWGLGLLIRVVHELIKAVKLGVVNSILGAAFMTFKVLILVSVVLNIWAIASPESEMLKSAGSICDAAMRFGPALMGYIGNNF